MFSKDFCSFLLNSIVMILTRFWITVHEIADYSCCRYRQKGAKETKCGRRRRQSPVDHTLDLSPFCRYETTDVSLEGIYGIYS